MQNFKMDWEFAAATDGNIALTGEIDLPDSGEFTIAVAFGRSYESAPPSYSNRWQARLNHIVLRTFVSGSAQWWIGNLILVQILATTAECIG